MKKRLGSVRAGDDIFVDENFSGVDSFNLSHDNAGNLVDTWHRAPMKP